MINIKRKALLSLRSLLVSFESMYDSEYLAPDVSMPKLVTHRKWENYLYEVGNKPGMKILEIGSREVTSKSTAKKGFSKANYVGFDYYPGANVDVVGDAHMLSSYFKPGDSFDIISIPAPVLSTSRCRGLLQWKLQNC